MRSMSRPLPNPDRRARRSARVSRFAVARALISSASRSGTSRRLLVSVLVLVLLALVAKTVAVVITPVLYSGI